MCTHRLISCVRFCIKFLEDSSWPSSEFICPVLTCSSWANRSLTRTSACAASRTPPSSLWTAVSSTRTSSYWQRERRMRRERRHDKGTEQATGNDWSTHRYTPSVSACAALPPSCPAGVVSAVFPCSVSHFELEAVSPSAKRDPSDRRSSPRRANSSLRMLTERWSMLQRVWCMLVIFQCWKWENRKR